MLGEGFLGGEKEIQLLIGLDQHPIRGEFPPRVEDLQNELTAIKSVSESVQLSGGVASLFMSLRQESINI